MKEVSILEELMRHNLDQHNIVKLYSWYQMKNTIGLVLELLDITLWDYMKGDRLPLKDIRLITEQMATALYGLKSVGVIHGDIKPNNIMLVKDQEQSFTLKLIDFGLSFHTSEGVVGTRYQVPYYRAPEIMLGLPFNEAIDMWSLGAVLGFMMFGELIFPWFCEYNLMQSICEILGQPADHLLNAGLKTSEFFIKTSDNKFTLMTHDQYWKNKISFGNKKFAFSSLDDLKVLGKELGNEAEGWGQCVELLKAMLKVDASERITPSEVLRHPFITQSYLNENQQPAADEPRTSQASTDLRSIESVSDADDSIKADQTEDTQSDRNHFSDVLRCKTLVLDADPPGSDQDTSAPEEIQSIITELEETISDDSKAHEETKKKKKKKKKKKNCIRRFFSWMRKTFCFCSSTKVQD
uniref:homeodomain-interacting protein kinase 2-like n=1 Tax=Scatophagus argus TaxID=75038 RepID=UPI001ED7DE8F|nr:homeodomain-interacting protein kinase 2-like [Scatophagus argus]